MYKPCPNHCSSRGFCFKGICECKNLTIFIKNILYIYIFIKFKGNEGNTGSNCLNRVIRNDKSNSIIDL